MMEGPSPPPAQKSAEISALIETFHRTQQRLEELTAGQVDSVINRQGQAFFLQRAQEELRLAESMRQAAILDALPAQVALLDSQGLILSVNAAWRQADVFSLLQTPALPLGENYLEACERVTDNRAKEAHLAAAGIRDILQARTREFAMEYLCPAAAKDTWFRLMVTPLLEKGPTGAVVMHLDITEQKRVEQALSFSEESSRNSSEQLAKILDSSPDVICAVDASGYFVQVSAACQKVWGYPPEELIGTPYIDKVLPEDHAKTRQAAVEIMGGKTTRSFENRYVRKDGAIVHIIWSASWSATDQTMFCVARDHTEIKQADMALKESQSRYRSLFENMLEGYAYCRVLFEDGRPVDLLYLEVNEAFGKLTGLRDVVGRKISEVIPGILEENAGLFEAYVRVASTGTTEQRLDYIPALGQWLETSVYSKEKDHFIAVFENVTTRHLIEKETQLRELRYRSLVEATSQIVWNTPASGEFTTEQPSWTAFTGQSFAELRGSGWINAVHPEDRDETNRAWSNAFATKSAYEVEHRLRARDNSYRNMSVRAVPILDEVGAIREWIGVHKDVTERKLAEEHIKEQAALLDKTRDAISVRNLEGIILFWNKGAERMYGWSAAEAVGRDAVELLKIDREKFREVNALALRKGEWNGQWQHVNAKGVKLDVDSRWTVVFDRDGEPRSILIINTDITEKKQIESQFLRAQRMESIGTLAGGVAHDLNNILAPILMSIQILKLTANDAETTEILRTIENSAKRGADIVRQVLSFARGVESQRIRVQATTLLDELESIIRGTFPKNIQTEFLVPKEIWTIEGDPTQIHQILLNLVVNARDAMPNGGTLKVSVENAVLDDHYSAMNLQAKPGRYVIFNVEDSGVGMSRKVIDKIFEPFFTTKELSKGTGLGLSTVMAVVKSHEGLINVYSEPGRGSTFKVYLPAMAASSERPLIEEASSLPRGKGETVLVIDDEASIRKITSQTLEAFGYRSLTAVDGAEGVAIYAQNMKEIAVVVTDLNMPVMSGLATIRALLRINPLVKMIAASGLNVNGDANTLKDMGVTHLLAKPYTGEALLVCLHQILKPLSEMGGGS